MHPERGAGAVQPSFRQSVLYRYWFFGWLFHDVNRGSLPERIAAWRHNRAHARWLPTYLRRWMALGALSFWVGCGFEPVAPPLLQMALYLPGAISVSVSTVALAAWMGFRFLPEP